MGNQKTNSVDRFAGQGFRSGMAKDQLIFTIICSSAVLVAAVTLVYHLTGSSGNRITAGSWQCLGCGFEFKKKTRVLPPIECLKCGGDAVRVTSRTCPSCNAKVPYYRISLTEQERTQRDAAQKQAEPSERSVTMGGSPMMMLPPMVRQYWVRQADDSFAWSPWMSAGSPEATQLEREMRCPECDGLIFPRP